MNLNVVKYESEMNMLTLHEHQAIAVASIEVKDEVYLLIGATGQIVGVQIMEPGGSVQGAS